MVSSRFIRPRRSEVTLDDRSEVQDEALEEIYEDRTMEIEMIEPDTIKSETMPRASTASDDNSDDTAKSVQDVVISMEEEQEDQLTEVLLADKGTKC